jgi:hypothetical protein
VARDQSKAPPRESGCADRDEPHPADEIAGELGVGVASAADRDIELIRRQLHDLLTCIHRYHHIRVGFAEFI